MSKKTRREIKEMFKAGAQPTGQDFSDFTDSAVNALDDGITKPSETYLPLRVESNGDEQNLFDFYDEDGIFCWRINQYPTDSSQGGVSVQRAGLNIEDSNGDPRFFIKQDNGDIGIGTVNPTAKLHVVQPGSQGDSFRVDDIDQDTTPFLVSGSGALNIRVNPEDYDESLSLNVKGPVRLVNTNSSTPSLEIYKGTDLAIDTDGDNIADKPEAAFSVMKNGAIGIGTDAPEQGILIKGDLKLGDGLAVDGDTTINGNLTVQGNVYSKSVDQTLAIRDVRLGDQDEDTVTVNGEILSAHSTGSLCIKDSLNIKEKTVIGSSYYTDGSTKLASSKPVDGLLVEGNTLVGFTAADLASLTDLEAKLSVKGGLHVGDKTDPGAGSLLADTKIGIGITAAKMTDASNTNKLDVKGAAAIGETYAGIQNAPANGLIIEGNVGIGTFNPTEKLEINGGIKAQGMSLDTVQAETIKASGNSGLRLVDDSESLGIFVMDGGNVGIGTQGPGAKLDVNGAAKASSIDVSGAANLGSADVSGLIKTGSLQIGGTTVNTIQNGITGSSAALVTDSAIKSYVEGGGFATSTYVDTQDNKLRDSIEDLQDDLDSLESQSASTYATKSYVQTNYALKTDIPVIPDIPEGVPTGTIVMFNGTSIPTGWSICDGTNGTPNLKDKFIVAAGDSYDLGSKGGEATVTLTKAQMPKHSHPHSHKVEYGNDDGGYGYAYESTDELKGRAYSTEEDNTEAGGDEAHNNLPPYYALYYIMKTG